MIEIKIDNKIRLDDEQIEELKNEIKEVIKKHNLECEIC